MKKLLIALVLISIGRLWWTGKEGSTQVSESATKNRAISKTKLKFSDKALSEVLDQYYKGGARAFYTTIVNNLIYPSAARQRCLSGLVIVGIEVDNKGMTKVNIIKDIGGGAGEAVVDILRGKQLNWKSLPFGHSPIEIELGIDFRLAGQELVSDEGHVFITASPNNADCLPN